MRFPLLLLAPILLAFLLLAAAPAHAHPHPVSDELPSLAPLVKKSAPAVVSVMTLGQMQQAPPPMPAPFQFFHGPFGNPFFNGPQRQQPRQWRPRGQGSGVIVDAQRGYLLTNHHVIDRAQQIKVVLADRRQFDAELVGADPETDIALLRIDADSLTALPFAESDSLEVGDYVVAIGSPLGLGQTVTSGIVSAVGRSGFRVGSYEDFVQTDAAINFGNSGGPLLNLKGEMVGINTAIMGRGGNIGIGFAIPVDMASRVMDQILTHGEVQRGHIGVSIQDLTHDIAEAFGVAHERGAVVTQVLPGSPAEEAGIQVNDVIVEMNGEPIEGSTDLRNKVGLLRVGDRIRLAIVRDGASIAVDLAVGERVGAAPGAGRILELEGVAFGPLTPSSPLYGRTKGVLVVEVEPESRAWEAGLRDGDVVTAVNRRLVEQPGDIVRAVEETGRPILLNVRRGSGALLLVIR